MKKIVLILLLLASCVTIKNQEVEYILAMNSFGDKFYVSIPNLIYETQNPYDNPYKKTYFFYENVWHYGDDWFKSLDYPFRNKKEQEKFIKRFKKKTQ